MKQPVKPIEDGSVVDRQQLRIRPMRLADVEQVLAIERQSFRTAWSRDAFVHEIHYEDIARPLVAELDGEVVGYITAWFVRDEIHITNLAVSPKHRRKGIADALLRTILDMGRREGYRFVYLEVRRSNLPAIRLYEKWGFRVLAIRRGYYQSDGEDALVMARHL